MLGKRAQQLQSNSSYISPNSEPKGSNELSRALTKRGRGLAVGSVNGGLGEAQELIAGKPFGTKKGVGLG